MKKSKLNGFNLIFIVLLDFFKNYDNIKMQSQTVLELIK